MLNPLDSASSAEWQEGRNNNKGSVIPANAGIQSLDSASSAEWQEGAEYIVQIPCQARNDRKTVKNDRKNGGKNMIAISPVIPVKTGIQSQEYRTP